jgi:hypothetical protein
MPMFLMLAIAVAVVAVVLSVAVLILALIAARHGRRLDELQLQTMRGLTWPSEETVTGGAQQ